MSRRGSSPNKLVALEHVPYFEEKDDSWLTIPKKGKRGRRRHKDCDYLEKCFIELEEKRKMLARADELNISFAERRRLRN